MIHIHNSNYRHNLDQFLLWARFLLCMRSLATLAMCIRDKDSMFPLLKRGEDADNTCNDSYSTVSLSSLFWTNVCHIFPRLHSAKLDEIKKKANLSVLFCSVCVSLPNDLHVKAAWCHRAMSSTHRLPLAGGCIRASHSQSDAECNGLVTGRKKKSLAVNWNICTCLAAQFNVYVCNLLCVYLFSYYRGAAQYFLYLLSAVKIHWRNRKWITSCDQTTDPELSIIFFYHFHCVHSPINHVRCPQEV